MKSRTNWRKTTVCDPMSISPNSMRPFSRQSNGKLIYPKARKPIRLNHGTILVPSQCMDRTVSARIRACRTLSIGDSVNRPAERRSEEHTSELQSLMRISYAVFCLKTQNLLNIAKYTYNGSRQTDICSTKYVIYN